MKSKTVALQIPFLVLLIFSSLSAGSGKLEFEHLTTEQGLSSNMVTCITQDRQGFIWIGTWQGGLNRYDGISFKTYTYNRLDPTSISSNNITAILEDRQGTLWIASTKGLNRFCPDTESFIRFKHNPDDPNSISDNFVYSLCKGRYGTIWIGTVNRGLNRFNYRKRKFEHFVHDPDNPNSLSNNMILHLLEDRKGRLWIGTDGGGLNVLSTNSLKWTRYQNDPRDPKSLSHTRVKALYQDKKGNIWIGTFGGGLNRFDDKTGTFTRYIGRRSNPNGLMNNYIFSILEDRDNRFWVGTSNGVHEFIRDRNEFVHHGHIPGDPGSFSLYSAEFIFEDRSGLLWMGSSNGINLLDKRRKKFHHIYDKHSVLDGNIPDSLSHNHVDAIYESQDGLLWFGTWGGGLNAYDPESGSFTFFKNRPDDPGAISCNTVSCIYEEDSGNLWIGTKKGLNYFNRRKRTFTRFYHNPENSNSLADDFISSIEEGYEGMIWIGTINGLDRFNPRTHSFHHFKHDPRNPNSLNSNSINCLLLDQQQNLWVGTSESGLNRYDENDDTFYQYMTEPANPASLSCNQINTIFETRAGTIWVGTADGLNRFIPEQDSFQSFTHKEGLPHHYISSILEDENRYLWISTIKGISKFNPAKNSFRNYGSRDGLVNGNFTACSHKTRSGEMFFGSTHGINSFVPEKVKDNPYIPPIVFTSVTIHTQGKELRARESPTDKIRLSYRDTVSIHFAALSYTRPSRNRYAYKINTLHDSWIHLGNQHEIILAGMEPGEYILHVKGSNHDGVWNHEGASIGLIISPPFWKTWWFRILAVIFIILLILIWHRTRMKNMAHRLKTEAAVSQFLAIHDISRREREILKLMLQGKSNKEIEDLLFISLHTVKNHVYHIFQKLKINSRGQLINLFREYLLSQEEE